MAAHRGCDEAERAAERGSTGRREAGAARAVGAEVAEDDVGVEVERLAEEGEGEAGEDALLRRGGVERVVEEVGDARGGALRRERGAAGGGVE